MMIVLVRGSQSQKRCAICKCQVLLSRSYVRSNVLSFYRSQNVLGQSKYFVQDQKIELHSVPLDFFLLTLKLNLLNANHLFVWHNIKITFGLTQNILGSVEGQGIDIILIYKPVWNFRSLGHLMDQFNLWCFAKKNQCLLLLHGNARLSAELKTLCFDEFFLI